ncbi:hypothetical protein ACFQZX_16105 [Mucilaginibacter litoreus]|uniref:Immunity protein 35 n=1 Tax=Mucilaginibacter litoreus TaxID=1048221 RepID=A0ABW3AW87_9SPHI
MTDKIKKAIESQKQLIIRYLEMDFDLIIDPYIYGEDLFQQEFVWAWFDHSGTCYKFFTEHIKSVKISKQGFEVQNGIEYYYASEESFWAFNESIKHYITFKGN